MKEQPTVTTERLILRPYSPADANDLQQFIGDRVVSDTLQYSLILTLTKWLKSG
jgi:hypothetical protein